MDLEQTRLALLTHSQQMVVAAQNSRWEELECLDRQWPDMLDDSLSRFGSGLSSLQSQLMQDNAEIQRALASAQGEINSEMNGIFSRRNKIQAYLK